MSLIKGKQLQDLSIELGKINWEGYTVGDTINGISATKSPVNKTYVDNEILSNKITLVSGSGTTVNGSSFDLGGTISSNILIDGSVSNYDFILGDTNKIGKFTVDSNGIVDIISESGYFRADSNQSSIGISGATNDIVNLTNISLDLSHHELTAMGIDAITSVQVPDRDLSFWNAINTNIPTTGNSLVGGGEFVTGYNGTGGFYVQTTDEEKNTSFISSRNSLVNKGIINSSIIGGENIIANQSNTVYLPKLRIGQGANAIISAGSTEDLLAIDGTTGEIVKVTQGGVKPYVSNTVQTIDSTLTPLTTIPIVNNTFKGFELHITATQSDLSNTKYMRIEGAIKNNAGVTSLVGSPTVFTIAQDAGAAVWEVAVSANDTNDELLIEVNGATATTIDWTLETRLI